MKRLVLFLVTVGVLCLPVSAVGKPTPADRIATQQLLAKLIAIRTVKGEGQVPKAVDLLVETLKVGGFTDADIVRTPVTVGNEPTMGLVVRYASANPTRKPIAILAHMDVVGVVAKNWHTDPFQPIEKDGYLYGRGSIDNKFAVALLVNTFVRLKREGFVPDRDLVLALAGDEESGMLTSRANIQQPFVRDAEYALNADAGGGSMSDDGTPIQFTLQAAEKTSATFTIAASNRGGHSALPRPDNAIYSLSHAMVKLEELRFPVEFTEISRAMTVRSAKQMGGKIGLALERLLADPTDRAAVETLRAYPEFFSILSTSCVATMLSAGNAPNALPQNATATVNCRILPGQSVSSIMEKITTQLNDPTLTITLDGEAVESPASPIRSDVLAALTLAVQANYPGFAPQPTISTGGTEGREYRRAGIPTYGAGSLTKIVADNRAHGTDERLPLEPFYKELTYWDVLFHEVGKPLESPAGKPLP
ncbi:M20/M25/M40 family metallo-hydrolase [soil metagenome]